MKNIASFISIGTERSIIELGKKSLLEKARAIISCLAVNDMGYSTSEVPQVLNISRVSAGRCADRGQKVLLCRETTLSDIIERRFLDDAD